MSINILRNQTKVYLKQNIKNLYLNKQNLELYDAKVAPIWLFVRTINGCTPGFPCMGPILFSISLIPTG
jgi:hypothetical protein